LFQEEATGSLGTGRILVLKKIIKRWERSFQTNFSRKVTSADIQENPAMFNLYKQYKKLKPPPKELKTLSQSAPDETAESISISASGAQPAPSTILPLQLMTADVALLRARMRSKVQEEPAIDSGASHDEIMSMVQRVEQKQPRKRRGGAFSRSVLQCSDVPSVSSIPRFSLHLPALHPETQASFEQFGLFPFVGGQKVPWDSDFFFRKQLNIDEQGDDKHSKTTP
jgi:hypothetical protein